MAEDLPLPYIEMCRLCGKYSSVSKMATSQEVCLQVFAKINKILSGVISSDRNFPEKICWKCVDNVNYSYGHIFKIVDTQVKLTKQLKQNEEHMITNVEDEFEIENCEIIEGDEEPVTDERYAPLFEENGFTTDGSEVSSSGEELISNKINFIQYTPVQSPKKLAKKEQFFCAFCTGCFTMKKNMKRHIMNRHRCEFDLTYKRNHEETKCEPTCALCGRTFTMKKNLKRHIMKQHNSNSSRAKVKIKHVCDCCNRIFTLKSNLRRHIRKQHNFDGKYEVAKHICPECGMEFVRKDTLCRHIDNVHNIEHIRAYKYLCELCGCEFLLEKSMVKHMMTNNHWNRNTRIMCKSMTCVLCRQEFKGKQYLLQHLQIEHKIIPDTHYLSFPSPVEFYEWKTEQERIASCQFVKSHGISKRSDHSVTVFECERSGAYRARPVGMRTPRTKKINGFCMASITLRQYNDRNVCDVTYVSNHLGHLLTISKSLVDCNEVLPN